MREIVTFDAYGTLVDFRLNAPTEELLRDRIAEVGVDTQEFLSTFNVMRFQAVLEDYRPYDEVLRSSMEKAMRRHGLRYQDSDGDAIVAQIPTFGPFPEVPDALRRLKSRYEIAIISNTQDHLIKKNIELIGVEFDHVITAEQARAYKPDRQTFEYAYKTMDIDPAQVVHVAQGWEYDIIPAGDLGLKRVVWINRNGLPGSPAYQYDELSDMTELPELLGC
ncbi:haloacid dehalogenase type II [Streptomyces sp. TRM68367]|uniref:haloacid dehalogenase type II n=1 Tax=Streptomyces sp. TRM68367 TaxID=2758415 RepID=UPI00165B4911|nr:haloacid dehalogenase type II [Streptomyces sp. TRM68367]MBC9728550.1 haloacid dehalogenase type II [Streptomyces sp. TRM68367]